MNFAKIWFVKLQPESQITNHESPHETFKVNKHLK